MTKALRKKWELVGVLVCALLIVALQFLPDGGEYYRHPIQLPHEVEQSLQDVSSYPAPSKPNSVESLITDAGLLLRVLRSVVLYFITNVDPLQAAYYAGFWQGRIRGFLEGILVCVGLVLLVRIIAYRQDES